MTSLHMIVLLLLTLTPPADRRRTDAVDRFSAKTRLSGAVSADSLNLLPDQPNAVDPRRELSDEEAYEEEEEYDLDLDLIFAPCPGFSILPWSTGRVSRSLPGAAGRSFPFHGDCRVSPLRC